MGVGRAGPGHAPRHPAPGGSSSGHADHRWVLLTPLQRGELSEWRSTQTPMDVQLHQKALRYLATKSMSQLSPGTALSRSLGGSPSLPSQDKRADRQGEALAVFACPGATACEGVRRYLVEP